MFVENDLSAVSACGRSAAAVHGRNWREAIQLMVGCFDAAGHESDQPYLVVAGFVSSAGDWDDFSTKWAARLSVDGLPFFHAGKFAHSEKPFESFAGNEPKRRQLQRDLMDLVLSHTYRLFVHGVKPADFAAAFTEAERKAFDVNAYAMCGRTCVADLGRWLRGGTLDWSRARVPDLFFEDGDIGKGMLRDLLVKHNYPEPKFPPGKRPRQTELGIEEPYVPLQAADWLAYEAFQLLKKPSNDRATWRWAMREFTQYKPGILGLWTVSGLQEAKEDLEELSKDRNELVMIAEFSDLSAL